MSEIKLNPIATDRELLFEYIYEANEKGLRPLLPTPFIDTNKNIVVEGDAILTPKDGMFLIKFDNERGMFVGVEVEKTKARDYYMFGFELKVLCSVSKIIQNG